MNKILIIEDEPTNAKYLSFILKSNGYNTRVSLSGKKGLQIFNEEEIDLVFCDFQLNDINGSKVLKSIKKVNPDIPIIIFTGYADAKTAVNMMKLGAFDFLIKPLVPAEVLMVVNKAIATLDDLTDDTIDNNSTKNISKADKVEGIIISEDLDFEQKFIVGESNKARQVQTQIKLVAKNKLYRHCLRRKRNWERINCL